MPLGDYSFDNVESGKSYIITAIAKRSAFNQEMYILNVVEDVEDVNFIARDATIYSPATKQISVYKK